MPFAVVGLRVVSLAVRAVDLSSIPPLLGGDEGALGLSARQFVAGERDNVLAIGWFSLPAMHASIVS